MVGQYFKIFSRSLLNLLFYLCYHLIILIYILNFNQLILTSIEFIIAMDLLAERITESINDLALQIDVLHKLSENDR
jgi:hypothetical protein